MEWGIITTLVAEVLFGGGLITFVTIKDKKTAAILENMQKVIEEERGLSKAYREDVSSLKAEIREKDEIIRGKEDYIRELHREKSDLHDKLDKANSSRSSRIWSVKMMRHSRLPMATLECRLTLKSINLTGMLTITQLVHPLNQ